MINKGDWVTHNVTGERFEITDFNEKYVWLRKENGFRDITTHETLYKWMYLKEKQRADELEDEVKAGQSIISNLLEQFTVYAKDIERADRAEKRWSELKERIIKFFHKNSPAGKQYDRSFLCLMDELEGKENVFETVQQLEEDGE